MSDQYDEGIMFNEIDANMAWRWAGTVLLEGEKGFHRIKGYRQMATLIEALSKAVDRLTQHQTKHV